MNKYLYTLIFLIITFIIIFLYYYFFYIKKNNKNTLKDIPIEIGIIQHHSKLNLSKINYNKLLLLVSIITSFNIAFVINLVYLFEKNIYLVILFSTLILMPLMYISYSIIGSYFKKKEVKNDE